jgi:hypothetical protein
MGSRTSGRRGLAPEVVDRVQRLIHAKWNKTRIAAEEKIHRATVHKIANGTHPECTRERRPRCPGCGAKVLVFPCLHCQHLGLPCEPPPQREPAANPRPLPHSVRGHCPLRKELSMSQLSDQLKKLASQLEDRAAKLRAQAEAEEAKAQQLTQSAEILAAEGSSPAPKKAPKKAPPAVEGE